MAKVIATETGRVIAVAVDGKPEELEKLVGQLADRVAEVISKNSDELVGRVPIRADRVAAVEELFQEIAR